MVVLVHENHEIDQMLQQSTISAGFFLNSFRGSKYLITKTLIV